MTDVLLFDTDDAGDIQVELGEVRLTGGLDTAVYLSLWGGNPGDPGERQSRMQFWGNWNEPLDIHRQRSRTQHLLLTLALTGPNLRRLEEAVKQDLVWMVSEGVVTSVEVTAVVPALNTVRLDVSIIAQSERTNIVYLSNWEQGVAP